MSEEATVLVVRSEQREAGERGRVRVECKRKNLNGSLFFKFKVSFPVQSIYCMETVAEWRGN